MFVNGNCWEDILDCVIFNVNLCEFSSLIVIKVIIVILFFYLKIKDKKVCCII